MQVTAATERRDQPILFLDSAVYRRAPAGGFPASWRPHTANPAANNRRLQSDYSHSAAARQAEATARRVR